jgi:hypothetical protein
MSRSYLSLNSKTINNQRRQTNILTNAFKTTYLEDGTTTGGGGGTTDGVSQAYVDGSLNDIRSNYALSSSLSNYALSSSLSNYPLTTYVDGSLNNIRTNYATKTYVDTNISNLINSAPETLNTLNEIASALQSDASFGTNVYARINASDASINFIQTNYPSTTYVDGSLNNIRTNYALTTYVDGSLNDIRSSFPSTTYVDGSLNNIRTNYALTTYVDGSLNDIRSSFPSTTYVDGSLNNIRTNYALTTYVDGSLNNIRTSDTTFNGNITLGNGTRSIAINKQPSASYALDISGATYITGNLSINKRPSDVSYSYFDMSSVNMNIFNVSEKFSYITTGESITLDYSKGSIFVISAVAANITSIAITNVPTTLSRSVMVTVMLSQTGGTFYILPSTTNTITINGASITYLRPNATAFTAPASATMVIHQYNILWTSATPIVLASMSYMG